jgi:sugar phosphate permease
MKEKQSFLSRFYYGWVIVAVSALSIFFSGPGQTYSISIFIDYFIEDFNMSRSMVSGLYSAATLLSGSLLFLMGKGVDRFGQRKLTMIAAVMLGLTCIWNSFITGPLMLFIGFFFLRYWGQGSLILLPNTLVPQWFISKRGRAFSLISIGGFSGALVFPVLNAWLIHEVGWAMTWRVLAFVLLLGFAPLAYWLIRNTPESIGLQPDGKPAENKADKQQSDTSGQSKTSSKQDAISEISWTLKEAMRTPSFWLILYCITIPPLVNTGIIFHLMSIFKENGLTSTAAPIALAVMPFVSFPIGLAAGFLNEKFRSNLILVFVFAGSVGSLILLMYADSLKLAILYAVVRGILGGFEGVTFGVILPDYFGRAHIGSIKGLTMSVTVIGSAFGPLPFGIAFDWYGGYTEILWIMVGISMAAALAALYAKQPRKQETAASG